MLAERDTPDANEPLRRSEASAVSHLQPGGEGRVHASTG